MAKDKKPSDGAELTAPPAAPSVGLGEHVLYTTIDDLTPEFRESQKMGPFVPEVHSAEVVECHADGVVRLLVHGPHHDYRRAVVRYGFGKTGTSENAGTWSLRPTETSEL